MAYDWRTELPGVFARHADNCPCRDGGPCTCGPLGYRASIVDPDTGRRTLSPDFATIKTKLKTAAIFDGRNLYDPAVLKEMGFEYFAIGRKT